MHSARTTTFFHLYVINTEEALNDFQSRGIKMLSLLSSVSIMLTLMPFPFFKEKLTQSSLQRFAKKNFYFFLF